MFYTIYKVTNLINGKYYIGKHQTKTLDDGYMGSGKLLKRAINKYGIENFTKEILEVCDTEAKMNLAERILVVPDPTNYNLCTGGQGGFGYINRNNLLDRSKNFKISQVHMQNLERNIQNGINSKKYKTGIHHPKYDNVKGEWAKLAFTGKSHTEETRQRMSASHKGKHSGSKNSQFGTCWITNGVETKKIPKTDLDKWLQLGYTKGRRFNAAVTQW